MGIENLKELIREVERVEEITFEQYSELEMKYGVTSDFISSLHLEIEEIKIRAGRKHLTPEIILFVAEEKLMQARFDFEYFTSLMSTLEDDDENLEEARKCQEEAADRMKKYSKLIGMPENSLNLNGPQK